MNLMTIRWAFEPTVLCESTCFTVTRQSSSLTFNVSQIAFGFCFSLQGRAGTGPGPHLQTRHFTYLTGGNAGRRCEKKQMIDICGGHTAP